MVNANIASIQGHAKIALKQGPMVRPMMLDMIQDHAHTAVLWIFDTIAWKVKGGCPRVLNFPKWTARSLSIRQELRVSPCNSSVTFNRNYSVMVPISISTFPAAWPFSKYSCALATSSRLNERSLANQGCGFDVTCYPPGNESIYHFGKRKIMDSKMPWEKHIC